MGRHRPLPARPRHPDERSILIEAEHPELAEAIGAGEVIEIHGEEMNPRLHFAIHEIVGAQLWEGDPPEVWETAKRLADLGYERHEIFHMIGSALATQIWHVLSKKGDIDHDRYRAALAALPESWAAQRANLAD